MNQRFEQLLASLDRSFRPLVSMHPVKVTTLPPNIPKAGVYLFTERGTHLYGGRSDHLRARLRAHGRPSSGHNVAPFAFRIARRQTGKTKASYRPTDSRADLEKNRQFGKKFQSAKERVRRMEIRFVEEGHPLRQALLEIYAAVALGTRYNHFENH